MKENRMNEEENTSHTNGLTAKNALEWTIFGFGLLITLSVVGCLIYMMTMQKNSPPELVVSYQHAASAAMPNRLKIKVRNNGYSTAENVIVEVALVQQDSTIETAELNFEFLPNFSEREGWVSFIHDPQKADAVNLRVVSFGKP